MRRNGIGPNLLSLSLLSAVVFDSGNFTYCIMRVMMLSDVRNTRLESLSLSDYIHVFRESCEIV